ncbi:hypothetical protein [Endozoicomonas sp. GU-1]|uniref:hypothetical protein n=1 Tax=Endozoicomonas sp. GU-1 TaxID=3009078 RepID=UPI0022B57E78|nr:hypothetical protein [Endozoicomonas sp. GU-1]WBA80436.1 hypothetical protein O2T12_19155 [Endozoicomonas sp. GU-1]
MAAAAMPKQTSDFKITKVDDITKSDCTSFKNRCFRNLLPVLDQKTLLEIISEFSDDDIKFILTLGRYQDNNEHYFNQLKRFDLPDEYHTRGHEEGLKKFNAMHHAESPKLYALFRDTLLAEARGSSRLEDEFGLYFTPSSVWLNPVAEKLRSLNCKRGIEVMGGKGYLSYFLKTYGFRMVVSDNHSNYQHPAAASPPIVVRNENSLDTVMKYQHRSDFLVISWPPLPTSCQRLKNISHKNMSMIIKYSEHGAQPSLYYLSAKGQRTPTMLQGVKFFTDTCKCILMPAKFQSTRDDISALLTRQLSSYPMGRK